eukprot:tig00021178_g19203.t1
MSTSQPEQESVGISRLPVELVTRILSYVPLQDTLRLRRVSKLWRAAASRAECDSVALPRLSDRKSISRVNSFREYAKKQDISRHLRSVEIHIRPPLPDATDAEGNEIELEEVDDFEGEVLVDEEEATRSRELAFGLLGAACGALAAVAPSADAPSDAAQSHGPTPRQRRTVSICLDFGDVPSRVLDECFPASASSNLMQSFVFSALAAMRPARAASPAASGKSPLEELKFTLWAPQEQQIMNGGWLPWAPDAGALRTFLAPFSKLRALELDLAAGFWEMTEAAAAVIAGCCPQLASVRCEPSDVEAVRALAALPLERLHLCLASLQTPFAGAVARLAAGRAAGTLRSLRFDGALDPSPARSSELRSDDLRALPRLPNLERLEGVLVVPGHVTQEEAALLGYPPKLRSLHAHVKAHSDVDLPGADLLRGLAQALRSARSLQAASIRLAISLPDPDPAALAELLRAAAASLQQLELVLQRPAAEEELEAVLACPPRADVSVRCVAASIADLLPFQVLSRAPVLAAAGARGKPRALAPLPEPRFRIDVTVPDQGLREVARGLVGGWLPLHPNVAVRAHVLRTEA